MLAIARFQVQLQGAVDFRAELEAVKAVLAAVIVTGAWKAVARKA